MHKSKKGRKDEGITSFTFDSIPLFFGLAKILIAIKMQQKVNSSAVSDILFFTFIFLTNNKCSI